MRQSSPNMTSSCMKYKRDHILYMLISIRSIEKSPYQHSLRNLKRYQGNRFRNSLSRKQSGLQSTLDKNIPLNIFRKVHQQFGNLENEASSIRKKAYLCMNLSNQIFQRSIDSNKCCCYML